VAALEQRDVRRPAEHAAEAGQVAREELILERARAGRDDGAKPRVQHGHEIREGLADAGARLDHDVRTVGEGVRDDARHPRLGLAIREPGADGVRGHLRARTDPASADYNANAASSRSAETGFPPPEYPHAGVPRRYRSWKHMA